MINKDNNKLNLRKFYEINNKYTELKKAMDDYYQELIYKNNNLDLEEVESKCNYNEVKDIYNTIKYCVTDNNVTKELQNIMQKKKELEYPEILGVHYFPDLLKLDSISNERKIKIDKTLRDAYDSFSKRRELHYLGEDVLNNLIDIGILEREYLLSCNCNSFECSPTILSESKLNGYKDYWKKELENEDSLTDTDDDEFNYGCIEIDCWHDLSEEITSFEEFNNYPNKRIQYKFIKKPNLTLENL